jgi:hypothetical protein
MDIASIASNLAARFNAANIVPPDGYDDIALATHQLPNAITTTPTALVFPPEGEFSYPSGHKRSTNLSFPVRFYVAATSDRPRATAALYAWWEVLIDQLEAAYDIDSTALGVTHAVPVDMSMGTAEYAEQEYAVIELTVLVHVEQGYSPST